MLLDNDSPFHFRMRIAMIAICAGLIKCMTEGLIFIYKARVESTIIGSNGMPIVVVILPCHRSAFCNRKAGKAKQVIFDFDIDTGERFTPMISFDKAGAWV